MQIPDDLLAGNDDTKDTNEEEQFYQHWASHERFNLDQAYIRQLAQIEDDYQQHLEVLQNHLTNSKMSGSQDQLTVQVKQQHAEWRKMDAKRMLHRHHKQLHMQIDAKDVEFKLVMLIKRQARREVRCLDAWIDIFLTTLRRANDMALPPWPAPTSVLPPVLLQKGAKFKIHKKI
ncbi:unnamed protein product [Aphanomyces euteiches]